MHVFALTISEFLEAHTLTDGDLTDLMHAVPLLFRTQEAALTALLQQANEYQADQRTNAEQDGVAYGDDLTEAELKEQVREKTLPDGTQTWTLRLADDEFIGVVHEVDMP